MRLATVRSWLFRVAGALAAVGTAHAGTAPANDEIVQAQVLASIDGSYAIDHSAGATRSPGDPTNDCDEGDSGFARNVWYRYTTGAATEYLDVGFGGPNARTGAALYALADGALVAVPGACVRSTGIHPVLLVGARLLPATTYYIEITIDDPLATVQFSSAPRYHVTTLSDGYDGHCDADCTLRDAVGASNAAPGVVLLDVPGTYSLTLPGVDENANLSGDLDVRRGIAVYGLGADVTRIDAGARDRVFDLLPQNGVESALLADLQIQNGMTRDVQPSVLINLGGGVRNAGVPEAARLPLSVVRSRFVFNAAQNGGAIASIDYVLVVDSDFSFNEATDGGGAIVKASLIAQSPPLRVERSSFSYNRARLGGAVAGDTVRINSSTLYANRAQYGGGVLHTGGGWGVSLHFATVVGNEASISGGGVAAYDSEGSVFVTGSIVDANHGPGNVADDCYDKAYASSRPAVTSSYTLWGSTGCHVAANDIVGSAGALAPYANYGGPTPTLPPASLSRAINVVPAQACVASTGAPLATDQRGNPRPEAGRCDLGAVETDVFFADGFDRS